MAINHLHPLPIVPRPDRIDLLESPGALRLLARGLMDIQEGPGTDRQKVWIYRSSSCVVDAMGHSHGFQARQPVADGDALVAHARTDVPDLPSHGHINVLLRSQLPDVPANGPRVVVQQQGQVLLRFEHRQGHRHRPTLRRNA